MKKQRYLLGGSLILLAVICGSVGIRHLMQEKDAGKEYEELREAVEAEPEPKTESVEEATEGQEETPKVEIPIDFETLKEQNEDVYAWICIPGTNVDYPILQHEEDNGYYLNHAIDGVEALEGSIYTENYNTKYFDDPNTVIYGHNMKNGTMFRTLHQYEDKKFFDENRVIYIYQPDRILEYRIFAAYVYDNRHLLLNFDLEDPDMFQRYLDDVFNIRAVNAHIDSSMEVGTDDRILTLSTCNAGIATQRYLVQAVLISISP